MDDSPAGAVTLQIPVKGSLVHVTREMVILAFDEETVVAAALAEGKKMIKLAYLDVKGHAKVGGQGIGGNCYVGFYPAR